ncbi:Crp/Fnr family transcriptional regulator [Saccharospirillum salsuginis]|uniref:Cyclic nucleotide-binding protein n=1 Tax=Saccharospirillum salsuginis TaxID=418750 RepID=A0A918KKA2_9GAMM|nr:Crp/Fnr family transcriptional regulator [Saccharospirillum salsuginis]GGX66468.1 cyclic nucleotide-binding protein [Saccharospirillum salsuginis]
MKPDPRQLRSLRQALAFWHPIPDALWPDVARLFSATEMEAAKPVVSAGEHTDVFYFVTEGLLRIYYIDRDGRETNKSFIDAGGFAGAFSSYSVLEPSPFHIQTLEPCRLLYARWEDMDNLYQTHPTLERLGRRIAEWLLVKKVNRERELLELDATERYQAFLTAHPTLVKRLPNYHIASYLGITDVSLSRIRQKMKART